MITVIDISGDKVLQCRVNNGEPASFADTQGISQKDILTLGQYYIVEINSLESDDSFTVYSFENPQTFNTVGVHRFIDKAITEAFLLKFDVLSLNTVNQISSIYIRPVPTYQLKKCSDDSIVQEFTPSEITQLNPDTDVFGNILKLDIDLSVLDEDVYYFEFVDEGVTYRTDTFYVKLLHECTFELTWSDTGNPFNFRYTDIGGFTQSLRVEAKLGKPKYAYDRNEVFVDSKGNRTLTYVRQDKSEVLTIAEMPEYCHNALALGLKHSSFQIDGQEYVFEGDEYSPAWRKSSLNAPVEVEVKRQDVNLVKSNC